MRKIFYLLLLLFFCANVNAQTEVKRGFYGYISGGPGFHNYGDMEAYLRSKPVLGNDINFLNVGLQGRVSANVLLTPDICAGIVANQVWFPSMETVSIRADIRMRQRGMGLKVGWVPVNKNLTVGSINFAVGIESFHYIIKNVSVADTIVFVEQQPITPSSEYAYPLRGTSYELSFNLMKLYSKSASGNVKGVMFGLDAGVRYLLDIDMWNDVGTGPPDYAPITGFVTLAVGFGGFSR